MAKKRDQGVPKCKACGYPMIMDETIIEGPGGRKIKRTFLHCVNGQCGHIERVGEYPLEATASEGAAKLR
jgi:hypothetical protein